MPFDPVDGPATAAVGHRSDIAGPVPAQAVLRVSVDATPLLGRPTGVGVFCAGILGGLADRRDLDVGAYAVSWRRRHGIEARLPQGVRASQRAMPARPLHQAWGHVDFPPVEWFVGPADVVHGTNFVVPPTRRAAAVVTVHDLTPLRYPELCDPASLAFPNLVRRALRRGAWVHTHSDFVAGEIVEAFGVSPERVRAVAPGAPVVGPGASLDAGDRRPFTLPRGTERYVLAIGTAEPRKDLPGLVAAFDDLAADHKDIALVLLGPDGWGTAALEAAIGAARHAERIVRTGWVSDAELGDALRGAAVLAYPSRYEGFGLPPLQAMAAGVPVVASRAGAIPEALGDAAALVPVGDRGALVDALAQVLDSEPHRVSLIGRGLARAARFTWARCAEGLDQLYRAAREDQRPIRRGDG